MDDRSTAQRNIKGIEPWHSKPVVPARGQGPVLPAHHGTRMARQSCYTREGKVARHRKINRPLDVSAAAPATLSLPIQRPKT